MNRENFNILSQVQKLLLVMESGRLVLEKKESDRILKLYVYQMFYVEVTYDIKNNKIIKIDTPEMEYIVDEYLDTLNVEDILNL
jgi:hypothetical protein